MSNFISAADAAGKDKAISSKKLITFLLLEQRFWERVNPEDDRHVALEKAIRVKLIDDIISGIGTGLFPFKYTTTNEVNELVTWLQKNSDQGLTIDMWGQTIYVHAYKKYRDITIQGKELVTVLKEVKRALIEKKEKMDKKEKDEKKEKSANYICPVCKGTTYVFYNGLCKNCSLIAENAKESDTVEMEGYDE